MTLTDNGKVLLDEAMKTIDHANACIDRINDVRNLQSGTLNIGATYTFSPIISESVLQFMKKYPHIN